METELLKEFIKEFIPKSNRFRRGSYTHTSYISDTINGVFRKYFDIYERYDAETIIRAFRKLEYKMLVNKYESWRSIHDYMPETVWIGVDTETVRLLRLTLSKLSDRTGLEKRNRVEGLITQITAFKGSKITS